MPGKHLPQRLIRLDDQKLFGLTEAFLIQQIHHWTKLMSKKRNADQESGFYMTLTDWVIDLPMFSKSTIHNALQHLKREGVINISKGEGSRNNHRTWYSLNTSKLDAMREDVVIKFVCEKEKHTKGGDNKMYFSNTLRQSNLWRIANVVSEILRYKNMDDWIANNDFVYQNLNALSDNLRYNQGLYLYITKTLKDLIEKNSMNDELSFENMWKVLRLLRKELNVDGYNLVNANKGLTERDAMKWSQAKRDRVISASADHILETFISNTYYWFGREVDAHWSCPNFTKGMKAFFRDNLDKDPQGRSKEEIKDTYDGRIEHKFKSIAQAAKPNNNVTSLHGKFKALKSASGFDPTLG